MAGKHMIMCWAATQGVIALSSGEAELYALVKAAANTVGMTTLAGDFGDEVSARVSTDASATLGIVNRTGVGKLRHVRVQYLWLQERVRNKELKVDKVLGIENPADLFTKNLAVEVMDGHLQRIGFEVSEGRAETAPKLCSIGVLDTGMANPVGGPDHEKGGAHPCLGQAILRKTCQSSEAPTPRENDRLCRTGGPVPEVPLGASEPSKDIWVKNAEKLERYHAKARDCLFTPLKVEGAPAGRWFSPFRLTEGTYENGSTFKRIDSWTARPTSKLKMASKWTGKTTFFLKTA